MPDSAARQPNHQPEQGIDATIDRNVFDPDPVVASDCYFEVVLFGIAIHPALRRRLRHRRNHLGRWAEPAFIGADPRGKG